MDDEWHAWQSVVIELSALMGIADVNAERFTPLVSAVQYWGERLAVLRCEQDAVTRSRALTQAAEKYDRHATRGT